MEEGLVTNFTYLAVNASDVYSGIHNPTDSGNHSDSSFIERITPNSELVWSLVITMCSRNYKALSLVPLIDYSHAVQVL